MQSQLSAILLATIVAVPPAATAQDYPRRLPAAGGEAIIPDTGWQRAYDDFHYAPARRAGDYLYVSGVVIGRAADGPRTPETFKAAARRAFARIALLLAADGAGFTDVVMVNSFHDWSAPEFGGDRVAQFRAFDVVKEEFMAGTHPAWTAVGTSGLISANGIVEVQMIAYVPRKAAR